MDYFKHVIVLKVTLLKYVTVAGVNEYMITNMYKHVILRYSTMYSPGCTQYLCQLCSAGSLETSTVAEDFLERLR